MSPILELAAADLQYSEIAPPAANSLNPLSLRLYLESSACSTDVSSLPLNPLQSLGSCDVVVGA